MGARRPPNPPSTERRAANFWCVMLGAVLKIFIKAS